MSWFFTAAALFVVQGWLSFACGFAAVRGSAWLTVLLGTLSLCALIGAGYALDKALSTTVEEPSP